MTVVDAFGSAPKQVSPWDRWWIQGLRPAETAERVLKQKPDAAFVFAGTIVAHGVLLTLIQEIRRRSPVLPIVVLENTQAVTGYSLRRRLPDFFSAGATHVLTGEADRRAPRLLTDWEEGRQSGDAIDGLYAIRNGRITGSPPEKVIEDLDALPWPAWPLFPLEGYWSLGYAHGPARRKHLPLLTSRGCPYPCAFCVVPETSQGRWRKRSAANVADEMAHWKKTLGVVEFHIEDLNPSLDEERLRELSRILIERDLRVAWRIVSGMKLDPIRRPDTFDLMASAGCDYLSFSPESGSPRVLAAMKKTFPFEPALKTVKHLAHLKVRTQACFVLGFPGETDADRRETAAYVRQLARAGLDEVALFAASPLPGSALYETTEGPADLADLNFSPAGEKNDAALRTWRRRLYAAFLFVKLIRYPFRVIAQALRFGRRTFDTKMEMAPFRALCLFYWRRRTASKEGGVLRFCASPIFRK